MNQPLLVSRPKKKDIRMGRTEPIYLLPELCTLTGKARVVTFVNIVYYFFWNHITVEDYFCLTKRRPGFLGRKPA